MASNSHDRCLVLMNAQSYISNTLFLLSSYLTYLTCQSRRCSKLGEQLDKLEGTDADDLLEWLPSLWNTFWVARAVIRTQTIEKRFRLSARIAELGDVHTGLSVALR